MTIINRQDLLSKLKQVSLGASKKEVVQQSHCVVFRKGRMWTFNDEVACVADMGLDIDGACPVHELMKLLEALDSDEVKIEIKGEGLTIKSGRKRKSVVFLTKDISLPIDEIKYPSEWKTLPPDFVESIKSVSSCASTNASLFALVCVHLTPGYIESSDDMRICRYYVETGIENSLVRAVSLASISDHCVKEVGETADWIHFRSSSGCILSCRRYQGNYVRIDDHLKVNGSEVFLADGISKALKTCKIFSSDDEVMVEVASKGVRITGKGNYGYHQEVITGTKYSGDPFGFVIGIKLFKDILNRTNKCTIGSDRICVKNDKWIYVTMVMPK